MTWDYAYTSTIWPSLLTGLLLGALGVYSWRRRSVPGALAFAVGCLLAGLWMVGAMMEAAAVDLGTKIFWFKVQGALQLPAVAAMACFVFEYAWPGRWLTRRNLLLLSLAPLAFPVLVVTNDFHHLAWRGFEYDGLVVPQRGPLNWVLLSYAMLLGLVELAVFVWLFRRSPQHRWPAAIMATGQVVARIVYILDAVKLIPSDLPIDVMIIAFLFLMYAIALFGFRILDPIPLARQSAIEQLRAGLLVLDSQRRVVSLNPAAERMLGVPADKAKGRPVRDLLPAYPISNPAELGETEVDFSLGNGSQLRYYTMAISLLKDWRGLAVGLLLLMHDVTEQKQAQAQLVEQQRALAMLQEREQLARELHDSLGQAFAFVSTQGQTVRRLLNRGDLTTADEYVGRLVEVAKEADVDIRESILALRATVSEQGLFPALTDYLDRYGKNNGILTELKKSEVFTERAFEPLVEAQLLRIIQEALSNVRKHAKATCVHVTFMAADGNAQITVQDDGQGFEPGTWDDASGNHVGLRVMRERAEEVGGNLSIQSRIGQGTVVLVQVPVVPAISKEQSNDG